MSDTNWSTADLERIRQITAKRGLNKGKGYSFETIRAVLKKGNRSNSDIKRVASEYKENLQNFIDQE